MSNVVRVPHFSLPFRFASQGESIASSVHEQDSEEEVMQCVELIIRCPLGFREEKPNFGVMDPTFRASEDLISEIETAILLWEPRAESALTIEQKDTVTTIVAKVYGGGAGFPRGEHGA
jgi:phage baseplate assembly protein W